MRLISMCILLLVASAWSVFGTRWASLQFENGYLSIDTTKTCNVDTSYVNCSLENGLVYYSTLDTDYAVFSNPRIAEIRVYGWIPNDSLAVSFVFRHTIKEVLRYEFMKWQEWGILNMTKDSAQNLIDRVVDENFVEGCRMHHATRCEQDRSPCMCSPAGGGAGGGISEEDMARLPQKKVLADTSAKTPVGEQPTDSVVAQPNDSVGVTTPDSTDKPLFISRGAPVGGSLLGLRYSEFNVYGVFIRSGIWQGSLKATGSTRVVRFENGKTAIFR